MMSAKTAANLTQSEPCALQHYLRQMSSKAPSYVLSQGECQVAFQHWVAYVRGGDCGYPSDVTAKEHLRCPLLWCRESFADLTSTLQHVSQCPWLSNAWYWCPKCCRPESFLSSDEPCVIPRRSHIQRKSSKLRRAVTFFKHLGLKSCSRNKTSGSSATYGTESFDTWFDAWLVGQQDHEMEDTSHEVSTRAELADSSSDVHSRESYMELPAENISEMEEITANNSQDPMYLSRYTQEANLTTQPCELDMEPLVIEPQSRAEFASPTDSFRAIGAQFGGGPCDVEPGKEKLVSAVSTAGSPVNYQRAGHIISPRSELDSPAPAYNGPDAVSLPEVVDRHWSREDVTRPFRGVPLSSGHNSSLRDDATLSTQYQVEDLRETVRVLNEEWLRRCQSTPDLLLRASALSPRSLLDKGAQTLQLIYRGVLPDTFDALFALAHFACAAAYTIHGDNTSHCWNEFFQHITFLHNMIVNESDKRLYVQLVNLLFWPQCSSAQRLCGNDFHDVSIETLVPLRRPVIGLDELPPLTKPASLLYFNWLKGSAVLHECSKFLDGIEYAGILDRNAGHPAHLSWYAQEYFTSIEEMLRTIVRPLQQCDGIEALYNVVQYTVGELSNGGLRSVREVEVSLISNGRSSCLSPKIYKRYLDTVTSICDQIMHTPGPDWRDRCYVADIDMVRASLMEIASHRRRCVNVNTMPRYMQMSPESTQTPSAIEKHILIGSSLSAITSPTSTTGYSSATQPSPITLPKSSSLALTPSSPNTDVTHCPRCPAVFTGSKRNRAANLRRHKRSTPNHGYVIGLRCRVPGCTRIIRRSDNLATHVRSCIRRRTDAVLRRAGAGKRGNTETIE